MAHLCYRISLSIHGATLRVDDVAATGANTLGACKLLKRRDRLAEKLAEPGLPLLLLDRLMGKAGHVGGPCVLQPALLGLWAVGVLLVRHVVLQDGVARLAVVCARGGDASVRAVEHAQVLAPCAGRLGFSCGMRAPVAHDLPGDATLQRQDAASSDLFFRKLVLLVKQVERRKGEGRGSALCPVVGVGDARVGGGSRFDTLVIL